MKPEPYHCRLALDLSSTFKMLVMKPFSTDKDDGLGVGVGVEVTRTTRKRGKTGDER